MKLFRLTVKRFNQLSTNIGLFKARDSSELKDTYGIASDYTFLFSNKVGNDGLKILFWDLGLRNHITQVTQPDLNFNIKVR